MLNVTGPVPVTVVQSLMDTFLGDFDPVSVHLHLFQNNLTPSPGNVLADFIEATFTGYALKNILVANYPVDQVMPDGSIVGIFPANQTFLDTNVTVANTVYGAYLTDSADSVLIGSVRFDTPKIMDGPTKFITIELAQMLSPDSVHLQADVTSNG